MDVISKIRTQNIWVGGVRKEERTGQAVASCAIDIVAKEGGV